MENVAVQEPQNDRKLSHGIKLLLIGLIVMVGAAFLIRFFDSGEQAIEEATPQATTQVVVPTPSISDFVKGQLLVKFKPGTPHSVIAERLEKYNASVKSTIKGVNVSVVSVPAGQEETIREQLEQEDIVEYAEPDYIMSTQEIPNDTDFGQQYGFVNTGQVVNGKAGVPDADVNLDSAWTVSKGTGVKIALLDSGIDATHPDLASKIVAQQDFTGTSIVDTMGHGTHIAGIAGAVTNNGVGVAGACPECQLMIGKVLTTNVIGSISTLVPGIIWATDNGAKVISMSTGIIPLPGNINTLETGINYAWERNVVLVAAAGNFNLPTKIYPAAFPNVVSVAATTNQDVKASFSSYGDWVTIAAPGENIWSTRPNNGYSFGSGTSMATPLVAGTAGLLWATPYGSSNASVVLRLFETADPIAGTGTQWQNGRLNAARAVGAPEPTASPSAVPTASPSATPTSSPSAAPTLEPSTFPTPSGIIPTFYCGGSTNSICPSPTDSLPSPTTPISTGHPTATPSSAPSVTMNPCSATGIGASIAAKKKKKSKHKNKKGGVSQSMEAFLNFLIELLKLLLQLIGGGGPGPNPTPTPGPTSGLQPTSQPGGTATPPVPTGTQTPTGAPTMTTNPCPPTAAPTVPQPTSSVVPSPTSSTAAYFKFDIPPRTETFVFQLTNPARITEARALIGQQKIVNGIIVKEPAPYNTPWQFHFDPASISFADATTEVCDANISYVAENLTDVGGAFLPNNRWCPWGARILGEVTYP